MRFVSKSFRAANHHVILAVKMKQFFKLLFRCRQPPVIISLFSLPGVGTIVGLKAIPIGKNTTKF